MAGSADDLRSPLGVTLAPVLLRVALAVTFIWAGLGKVIPRMSVDAQQAAVLASMGVTIPPVAAAATPGPSSHGPDSAPTQPLPPTDPATKEPTSAPDSSVAPTPAERAVRPSGSAQEATATTDQPPPAAVSAAANTSTVSAAAAAPAEIKVRRMWGLALRIHACANPGLDEAGKPKMKLWPGFLGSGNWPRYFAVAVVVAELAGGILVAIGLLTRLGAFMLAGVMLGAIWLDQIGPAMQAGKTVLLLLPAHDPWDVAAWRPLLWQFSLLCSAAALMLLGAGAPSLDRALGWTRRGGDDDAL